jgi:hypothetical protein
MSFAVVLSSCIQYRDKGLHTNGAVRALTCPGYTRNFNSNGTKS